jgi:hypothetical protein
MPLARQKCCHLALFSPDTKGVWQGYPTERWHWSYPDAQALLDFEGHQSEIQQALKEHSGRTSPRAISINSSGIIGRITCSTSKRKGGSRVLIQKYGESSDGFGFGPAKSVQKESFFQRIRYSTQMRRGKYIVAAASAKSARRTATTVARKDKFA